MASSLSIIFQKEFMKLNVNTEMKIKNVKLVELNIIIATSFFEYKNLKDDLINTNVYVVRKIISKNLIKS